MKKKDLAIFLSRLETSKSPTASLEQYATDSEIAADVLWDAYLRGDVEGKVVADLGCGNGVLGIGALVLGAKKVYFVDMDKKAVQTAKENLRFIEQSADTTYAASFVAQHVAHFTTKVDVVFQNPPFGVQQEHADKVFLEVAMNIAKIIYSFHKIESKDFLQAFAKDSGFSASLLKDLRFPLRKTQTFHKKRVYYVPVGVWRLQRLCAGP